MTIHTICQLTGVGFITSFGATTSKYKADASPLSHLGVTAGQVHIKHPVFTLPKATLYHLAQEEILSGLNALDKALLHCALLNSTGLISYSYKLALPSPVETGLYLARTVSIVKWLEFRGKSSDLPRFLVTWENRGNLYKGFLKELEDFKAALSTKQKARAVAELSGALDTKLSRRETYGLKNLTPDIANKVCELISWTGPDADIAKQYLLLDHMKVLALLDSSELYLIDLANLMLDIEVLDWSGRTRDTVLAHLRGLVNMIHTMRPLNAEEKGLFTDTIEPVTDFLAAIPVPKNTGQKFEILSSTEQVTSEGSSSQNNAGLTELGADVSTAKKLTMAQRLALRLQELKPLNK